MLTMYIRYTHEGVWAWSVDAAGIFSAYMNNIKENGDCVSIIEVVKWLLKNTPIKGADRILFNPSNFNLADSHYWYSLGVKGQIESWELPKRNVSGTESSEG